MAIESSGLSSQRESNEPPPPPRPVAVIDIGTTSIRMAIAEIDHEGQFRTLETLSQAVNLGKDTFTKGVIEKSTIEECVRVLRSYRQLLTEYQVTANDQIRVVATSAVREALNRLIFLDRIYIATGIDVEPLDEAEVNRITYLGIQPHLESEPTFSDSRTLIMEVGGGSTELLLVQGREVVYAHTYRLGSLRLREMLEAYRAPQGKVRTIMESQIQRTVEQVVQNVPTNGGPVELIALGGDLRFAASQLLSDWQLARMARIPLDVLERFTDRVLALSVDELVQKYHLTFPEAETLGPALLAYVQLASAMELRSVIATKITLRDGLLEDMATRGTWSDEFQKQIVRSAVDLGRKFDFDEAHSRHVANLSQTLFDALVDEHHLDRRFSRILYLAALLHEIGQYISVSSYHKHSMYLILNSELFGLSRKDVLLVGLVARYHRRASPKASHQGYAALDRENRVAVAKMAAMLRVADALERSHSQRVNDLQCVCDDGRLIISIPHIEDLSLEQLALKQKGLLFEEVFGMQVLLRQVRRFPT